MCTRELTCLFLMTLYYMMAESSSHLLDRIILTSTVIYSQLIYMCVQKLFLVRVLEAVAALSFSVMSQYRHLRANVERCLATALSLLG